MQIHLSCLILSSFLINWISGLDPLECRTDKQAFDYKGTLSTTKSGKLCLSWSDKETIRLIKGWAPDWLPEEAEEAKEAKNYCRNMDEHSEGPYCFVAGAAPGTAVIEHCDVPYCPTTAPPTTTTAPTTLSPIPDYITRKCSQALSLFSFPDVEDNKVYYVCEFPGTVFQKITKKQCPEATVFHEWKKVCIHDKKHKASDHFNKLCITGNETFAHPTNCTKYLQCINLFSSPVVRSCPIGTVVTKLGNCEMNDHSDVSDRCAESESKTDSIEDGTKEDNDQQIQDDDQQEQDDTKKDDDFKKEKRSKLHRSVANPVGSKDRRGAIVVPDIGAIWPNTIALLGSIGLTERAKTDAPASADGLGQKCTSEHVGELKSSVRGSCGDGMVCDTLTAVSSFRQVEPVCIADSCILIGDCPRLPKINHNKRSFSDVDESKRGRIVGGE